MLRAMDWIGGELPAETLQKMDVFLRGRTVQAVGLGWHGSLKWYAIGIKILTGSLFWSHMSVIFRLSDQTVWRFESLFDRDVVGPCPIAQVPPDRRSLKRSWAFRWLPAQTPGVRRRALAVAFYIVEKAAYAKAQFAGLLFHYLPWTQWQLGEESEHVTCSEFASIVSFIMGVDLREPLHDVHDEVSPASAWRQYRRQFPDDKGPAPEEIRHGADD